jgi:hypothetical protein
MEMRLRVWGQCISADGAEAADACRVPRMRQRSAASPCGGRGFCTE